MGSVPAGKKPWYKSKTIWTNIITIAIGILMVFTQSDVALFQKPEVIAWVITTVGVLNVILRSITTEPIEPLIPPD